MKLDRKEIARFLWTIAAALLIAGYLRYTIQGELLRFSKILLIGGGVLVIAALALGFPYILQFFSKRSSKLGTNTAILTIAVLAILVFVNFAGYRHHKRWDLTTEKLYTLSDQTKKVVVFLPNDVTVVHFSKTPDPSIDDLMAEYVSLGPRVKYQSIDPEQRPEVAKQYGATPSRNLIASSGSRSESIEPGRGVVSEEDVTTVLIKLSREKSKTVCFVTGHGEKSVSDSAAAGYSGVQDGLKKENYSVKSINLVADNGVPPDCDVIVIAGPTQAFLPQETAMISKYLEGGGKALIEVDPETDPKLGDLFQPWNIKVGDNVVIDASGIGQLIGAGPGIPLVRTFGASPITKGFRQGEDVTYFPLARTVSVADSAKTEPETVELLKTSPRSFTTPNLKETKIKYDPKTDTLGPLSLGVAASRKEGDKTERLVVIGDSDFAANRAIGDYRNGDLFFNTISWLAQDENLISIRPKSPANRRVNLTAGQESALKWLDLVFFPGVVFLSGVYIWWKRR